MKNIQLNNKNTPLLLHLKKIKVRELEDYDWFPQFLRQHQTEYLALLAKKFSIYQPIKGHLNQILSNSQATTWTDTCSGTGGPIIALGIAHPTMLTDLYPIQNTAHLPQHIHYQQKPLDIATTLPDGKGLITMFNSLHHFPDKTKEAIVNRIVDSGRCFLFVEILQPSFKSFILVLLATTLGHWIMVPFMQPFSLTRLFFTYFFPLHTLTVLIDGMISVFKSKNARFYTLMAQKLSVHNYSIRFFKTKGSFTTLYCLEGVPK